MFPFQGNGWISDHSGSTERLEPLPPVLRYGFLGQTFGAHPCCPSRNQPHSPKGQGVESSGNRSEDSFRSGYSTWWGSRTRGVARHTCWETLARWRSTFLDLGHIEKALSRCLHLSSSQYPPHVSTTQPFFPNFHWPYIGPQPVVALVRAKKEVLGLQRLSHAAHGAMVAP